MFKNYVITSIRYLRRNKSYSLINIGGLSIGLASCLLIFYFLGNELSYDEFHTDYKNIYRINSDYFSSAGESVHMLNTPPALAPGVRRVIPEIERSSRLRYVNRISLSKDDNTFYERKGFYADSVFLDIFSFGLKSGDPLTALDMPNSIVITQEMAQKYFGESDAIGENIVMNNELPLKVTGILNPIPANSHIQFDFLISFPTYQVPPGVVADLHSWRWLGFITYVKLVEGADPVDVQNKIDKLIADNTYPGQIPHKTQIQSLKNIYLGSNNLVDDLASPLKFGSEFSIYSFGIIAFLILLIAGFNFFNLTTAALANRCKEIGLRKVLGAKKGKLVFQMLYESVILSVISLVIAYLVVFIVFSDLAGILGLNPVIGLDTIMYLIPVSLVITILLGMFTGLYPAIFLSSIKTVTALKGRIRLGKRNGSNLRNSLIVFQFCISIGLIVSTLVITKQINYLREQELGFNKENILVLKLLPEDMNRYYDRFKNILLQNSNIISVSNSGRLMGDPWPTNQITVDGQDQSEAKQITGNWVGYDFLKTMGITLKEGRTFSKEYSGDEQNAIIINEKAVEHLGLENPIGKKVWFFSPNGPRTVIGVVRDFNFLSLHHDISPVALVIPFLAIENMYIRVTPGNISEKIAAIKDNWQQVAPGIPIEINFMDERLNQLYGKEEQLSNLIVAFSFLAIILACLGLLGLVASMVNNRIKEVGIRKVLGASLISLILIFIRQYVFIILVAVIVSFPFVQYVLNRWLENFAYHIEISWWVFVLAGILALIPALLTVGTQVIKAATENPIKALKYE
ncbi:MAG: ABC transporter permease [Ignavibacteria bacterium]